MNIDPEFSRLLRESSLSPASDEFALEVRKLTAFMPVSCCVITDATGKNHCEHPPPPPLPWHTRARWRLRSWWSGLRMRVGSWVAGVDLDDRDEW